MKRTLRLSSLAAIVLAVSIVWAVYPTSSSGVGAGSRIPWQGTNWYLHGVNIPWYNFDCDFGCGQNGGASSTNTQAALRPQFAQLQQSGVHMLRWYVFMNDGWQVNRDASGAPTSVNPNVLADIDAALRLAGEYDLYLNLIIFDFPHKYPQAWFNDSTQRARLVQALTPMFQRYSGNPRLFSWEIFNEPEWDFWGNVVNIANVVATTRDLAAAIHANATQYVTVGSATPVGLPYWTSAGLDWYQVHWYPHFTSGAECARCQTYSEMRARYNLDKPIVIGEFYGGTTRYPGQGASFQEWYDKGYAGAWAWSLFPQFTADLMDVSMSSAAALPAGRTDVGPRGGGSAPPPPGSTPTATATATATVTPPPVTTVAPPSAAGYTSSSTAGGNTGSPGKALSFSVSVTSTQATPALVDIEVFGPTGQVFQQWYDNEAFTAGQKKDYAVQLTIPASAPTGAYTVKVGVFAPNWAALRDWNDNAGQFGVAVPGLAPPVSTTSATSTPPPAVTPVPPAPTPTPAAAARTEGGFTTSGGASVATVTAGQQVVLTASVQSASQFRGIVDIEVYGPSGNQIHQRIWDAERFTAGQTKTYTSTVTIPAGAPPGTYTLMVGVFTPNWAGIRHWHNKAAQFEVR